MSKMTMIDENVTNLFNGVLSEVSQHMWHMMEQLWINWSHLGVDNATKAQNIKQLIHIEKDLHCDVISETKNKRAILQEEINKLKKETEELSRALSVEITILDWKEDVMLCDYKKDLEEQISGYREQVEQRRMKMERLFEWQRDLAEKLGVTIQELKESPLPAEEELDKLREHLEVLQAERDRRAEIFLNTQMEVKDIMDKLKMKPQNKFEQIVVTSLSVDFKVTDLSMEGLAKLRQDLQEKFEQTNNRVLELRERLTKLWECLEEDQIYRESFLQSHQGCHMETETAIREEIRRLDQIKQQKIQVFVANVRTKIKLMWDACMYSNKEREEFVYYYTDVFSEDSLTLHELYLDKITKFYNDHKQIFEMVAMRKNLWTKMNELEARATEPGRYNNRGGQLLKEEKERKAIATNLPKIEAQLSKLVSAYEAKTGNTFTVDGKPLLQYIKDEWETRKTERHNKLSARKHAMTSNTALFRSLATSPLGKRNRTAAGLASAADKNGPPKRQLVTSSATKAISVINNHSALKRTAITTIKRRISGRLAARAVGEGASKPKRRLDYGCENSGKKPPKVTVNGHILKHKRTSNGKRRSCGRSSTSAARSSASGSQDNTHPPKDPLMETTMLTTYTDFKLAIKKVEELYAQTNTQNKNQIKMLITLDNINENQIGRSSLATAQRPPGSMQIPTIVYHTIEEGNTPSKKTPRAPAPVTAKIGKENVQHLKEIGNTPKSTLTYTPKRELADTPKNTLMYTPKRLTRSALKLNNDGFATPRAPLSANKLNMQRQYTATNMQAKTTPDGLSRSKTHSHLVRVKDLPPLI